MGGPISSEGSIGPVTVGSAAVPCADALETLVERTATRADNVITTATATRAGMAKLDRLIGSPNSVLGQLDRTLARSGCACSPFLLLEVHLTTPRAMTQVAEFGTVRSRALRRVPTLVGPIVAR